MCWTIGRCRLVILNLKSSSVKKKMQLVITPFHGEDFKKKNDKICYYDVFGIFEWVLKLKMFDGKVYVFCRVDDKL